MEILNLNFAIFVVKLAFCIVPIAIGIRFFTFSYDFKEETRQKISKKLLGDSSLIKENFYNFALYFIATIFILFGMLVALLLMLTS